MPSKLYESGMKVRREVLGDAHVDRALANRTPFDTEFQEYVTECCWGPLWTRPGLDRRTRSLITLALLAVLGQEDEFRMHVRASRNTGATPEDIAEALMHVSVYGGVPAANHAFRMAKDEYAKMDAAAGD